VSKNIKVTSSNSNSRHSPSALAKMRKGIDKRKGEDNCLMTKRKPRRFFPSNNVRCRKEKNPFGVRLPLQIHPSNSSQPSPFSGSIQPPHSPHSPLHFRPQCQQPHSNRAFPFFFSPFLVIVVTQFTPLPLPPSRYSVEDSVPFQYLAHFFY
jgi:hypothetical protein